MTRVFVLSEEFKRYNESPTIKIIGVVTNEEVAFVWINKVNNDYDEFQLDNPELLNRIEKGNKE